MKWDYRICRSTLAQLGATRTARGRTPPVDVDPIADVALARVGRDLCLTGTVRSGTLRNLNPYVGTGHPEPERRDLSIDPLLSVRARVAGGAWRTLAVPAGSRVLPVSSTFVGSTAREVELEVVTRAGFSVRRALTAP